MKNNKLKKIISIAFLLATLLLMARFILGGDEDTWSCVDGKWQIHGNPSISMPKEPCR